MTQANVEIAVHWNNFAEEGFGIWASLLRGHFFNVERAIIDLYSMQARKILQYRGVLQKYPDPTLSRLVALLDVMEQADKAALYQVQKFLPCHPALQELAREFVPISAALLGSDPHGLLVYGPAFFISRPNTTRLLYKWHSEAHYMPKRRRFINVWMPLFGDRTRENGAMLFKVGSHKRDFPFSEYQGFDGAGQANHFTQFEIPDNFLESYPTHVCETKRGDAILFDRALVHCSGQNQSSDYAFALVFRIWDPSEDLTLSGAIEARPYGGDVGRPGLIVDPGF